MKSTFVFAAAIAGSSAFAVPEYLSFGTFKFKGKTYESAAIVYNPDLDATGTGNNPGLEIYSDFDLTKRLVRVKLDNKRFNLAPRFAFFSNGKAYAVADVNSADCSISAVFYSEKNKEVFGEGLFEGGENPLFGIDESVALGPFKAGYDQSSVDPRIILKGPFLGGGRRQNTPNTNDGGLQNLVLGVAWIDCKPMVISVEEVAPEILSSDYDLGMFVTDPFLGFVFEYKVWEPKGGSLVPC